MEKKVTYKRIQEIAQEELKRASASLNEEVIKDTMRRIIGDQANKLILQAMGLERDSWHSGELQFARNGSFLKAMGILSQQRLNDLAKESLESVIDGISIVLNENETKALVKQYREVYIHEIENNLKRLAKENANLDAPNMFEDYLRREAEEEAKPGGGV